MGNLVTRWLWIIAIVVVILLVVHPKSNANEVVQALSNQSTANIKALQGNMPSSNNP